MTGLSSLKKILLNSAYLCYMPQTISKVKDDFEEINQFISFRVADAELQPSSVRGGEDFTAALN